jgi:hypothetical protein
MDNLWHYINMYMITILSRLCRYVRWDYSLERISLKALYMLISSAFLSLQSLNILYAYK